MKFCFLFHLWGFFFYIYLNFHNYDDQELLQIKTDRRRTGGGNTAAAAAAPKEKGRRRRPNQTSRTPTRASTGSWPRSLSSRRWTPSPSWREISPPPPHPPRRANRLPAAAPPDHRRRRRRSAPTRPECCQYQELSPRAPPGSSGNSLCQRNICDLRNALVAARVERFCAYAAHSKWTYPKSEVARRAPRRKGVIFLRPREQEGPLQDADMPACEATTR